MTDMQVFLEKNYAGQVLKNTPIKRHGAPEVYIETY